MPAASVFVKLTHALAKNLSLSARRSSAAHSAQGGPPRYLRATTKKIELHLAELRLEKRTRPTAYDSHLR